MNAPLTPICASCRQEITGGWQVTDRRGDVLCVSEDCTRWASIRGYPIARRGRVAPPAQGRLFG